MGAKTMINTLLRAAFAAASLAFLPAIAAAQGSQQPPIGEPRPFQLPQTRSFTLDNGLAVTFIPYGLAPTTRISVQVRVGNIDDGDQTWLADLTGAMMEEGSAGRSKEELATAIAAMGGSVNVGIGWNASAVSTNVLSQYAADATALLASVLQQPDFDPAEFDRVRQNLIRNVDIQRAQPGAIATEAYYRILFGDSHPYGRTLPTEDQLRSYTMEDVQAFYADNFGAGRTRIYVAGRFNEDEMEAAIRAAFGDWARGEPDMAQGAVARHGPIVQLIDRPGAPQTTLRLGFPVMAIGDEDAPAMTVMNALLGGSFTSRLTRNLREDKGYTYSPGSGTSWFMGGGVWTFNADVTAADTAAALRETFMEIGILQTETPLPQEADGIRSWLSGIFILQNASTGGVIGQLANRDLWGLPDDYLDSYVPNILAVSDADISLMARQYLPLEEMVLVLVGDLSLIGEDVRALPQLQDAHFITAPQE
jgi:zinc protease